MKSILLTLVMVVGFNAFASVETAQVYVANGVMPNPVLAPLGQLVNVETGELLYVNSIISVVSPSQLNTDCLYQVNFVRDTVIRMRVLLIPPIKKMSCGHDFGLTK